MAYYGYHWVSTKEQHEDRGVLELEAFCNEKNIALTGSVFCDKQTGKTYDCVAVLDDTGGQYVNFTMEFEVKKE